MAEFSVVMKDLLRMHNAQNKCSRDCPAWYSGFGCLMEAGTLVLPDLNSGEMIEYLEAQVTKWAKEHPVPEYPTYREWLKEKFPEGDSIRFCPMAFAPKEQCTCDEEEYGSLDCNWACVDQQIPESVALRLGIQKKQG